MRNVAIADMTLRHKGEGQLSFKQKIEVAKQLDRLGVDVIELGPLGAEETDLILTRSICGAVKSSVISCETGLTRSQIDRAARALSGAGKARLQVCLPVSDLQMEYVCHKKPAQLLELITELVACARQKCAEVEFTCEDATRADFDFVAAAIKCAVEAGAAIVTVCDSAGLKLPNELIEMLRALKAAVPGLGDVRLSIQCGNQMRMAASSAFQAVCDGACQVKTRVGDGESLSLEDICQVIKARGADFGVQLSIGTTQLTRTIQQIALLTGTGRETTPFDAGIAAPDAPPVPSLSEGADRDEVYRVIQQMGYELSEDDLKHVYEAFIRAGKKNVGAAEMEAIIASTALQVPPTYKLINYVVTSGNTITATAHIMLDKQGESRQGLCAGDGPIDAAFLAIEQIIGHHYELDDFQIQAVTQGRDSMGDALVKLRAGGKLYSGKGISTDIIGASVRAYLNALNKIVYEEAAV